MLCWFFSWNRVPTLPRICKIRGVCFQAKYELILRVIVSRTAWPYLWIPFGTWSRSGSRQVSCWGLVYCQTFLLQCRVLIFVVSSPPWFLDWSTLICRYRRLIWKKMSSGPDGWLGLFLLCSEWIGSERHNEGRGCQIVISRCCYLVGETSSRRRDSLMARLRLQVHSV